MEPANGRELPPEELFGSVPVRHEWIPGDAVRLHVARAGSGPPVVLLHGFPENWRSWRHQIEPLVRAGFSVWAPDLRGYHLSDRPRERRAYHLRHLTADVAALVRATGHSRVHLVGHDWGGVIAWTFAGTYAGLLDKLVVLNAPHLQIYFAQVRRLPQMFRSLYVLFFLLPWIPERLLAAGNFRATRTLFERSLGREGTFTGRQIDEYIAALATPGALTAGLNYYRANARADAVKLGRSGRVAAETLVIWGARDPALSTSLLNGLETVAPRLRIHRIPDAGHWVQNEAPGEVNRVLLDFLLVR